MKIPTGKDIYIKINDILLANVQSYEVSTIRKANTFFPYDNDLKKINILSNPLHSISLKKIVCIQGEDDSEDNGYIYDFHELSNFSLSIVLPDKEIVFSECEWLSIEENVDNNSTCIDEFNIIANSRVVSD